MRRVVLLIAAVALAGVCVGAGAADATPTLTATYVPPDTITVTLGDGTAVGSTEPPGTVIPPGTYDVYVDDDAQVDGTPLFQITGPGVDLLDEQDAPQEYVETFLPDSTYTYQDDYEVATTERVFSTSPTPPGATTTTTTTTSPAPAPSGPAQTNADLLGSGSAPTRQPVLDLGLAVGGAPTLSAQGRPVQRLAAGRYTILADAAAAKRGFVLARGGGSVPLLRRAAGLPAAGVTVALSPGRWRLASAGRSLAFTVAPA